MSALLLVRHGQASFGSGDYDRLSPTGLRQSRVLGAALAAQGVDPAAIVSGTMRRQRETATAMVEAVGWQHQVRDDGAFDEFDVLTFLQDHAEGPSAADSRAFQGVLEEGMRRWADGVVLGDAGERFDEFVSRVDAGVQRVLDDGAGPSIVTTSAGVISWVVTTLIGGGVEQWIRLNRVCVNAAVTKVVHGRQGTSVVTFNEHGHFAPSEVTYR